MKRALFTIIVLTFSISTLYAVDIREGIDLLRAPKARHDLKKVDGSETANLDAPVFYSTTLAATLPGTNIGETAYNYQTNENLKDRIWWDAASGTIHAEWMYGEISEAGMGFPDRKMRYNYYDGSEWAMEDNGVPIENVDRTGYGALAVDVNNVAIPVSHNTLDLGTNVWYDFSAGLGFFTQSVVWLKGGEHDKVLEPMWPDIAVDQKDVWHVVAINNGQEGSADVEILNEVYQNILYFRSTDRGQSWSYPVAMFPDTVKYPLTAGAAGPNQAGNQQIEASDIDNGRVGILVTDYDHDLYLFESADNGQTWDDAFTLNGKDIYDISDSLTYPMTWDVVFMDSSEFGGPVDTLLYAFFEQPNYDIRPTGPADLTYIGGDPHVVWNELWTRRDHDDGVDYWLPNGSWLIWTSPAFKFMNGDSAHIEGGFRIRHWSPATGVSTIAEYTNRSYVYTGLFQQFLTMPQVGVAANGTVYCTWTKYSETDTLLAEDGVEQADGDYPLSFGRIWGAKSDDGGKTWYDAAQLIPEEDCIHQNLRYVGISNHNPNDGVHIIYQNTPDVPGSKTGGTNDDVNVWTVADMYHWKVPADLFPGTKNYRHGPEIELMTSSTVGGLDFGDIGDAGEVTKSIVVKNTGDEELVVEGLWSSHKSFMAEPVNFTVAVGGEQEVKVTFKPTVEDSLEEFLAIPNNDRSEGALGIPLVGLGQPVGVVQQPTVLPLYYQLSQNYPNPFNPSTAIQFSIVKDGNVKLVIYNTVGKEVAVLVDDNMSAGTHKIEWDAANLSSGVYFYRLTAGNFTSTKKMILMQ